MNEKIKSLENRFTWYVVAAFIGGLYTGVISGKLLDFLIGAL